jgi:hypothetical protein
VSRQRSRKDQQPPPEQLIWIRLGEKRSNENYSVITDDPLLILSRSYLYFSPLSSGCSLIRLGLMHILVLVYINKIEKGSTAPTGAINLD